VTSQRDLKIMHSRRDGDALALDWDKSTDSYVRWEGDLMWEGTLMPIEMDSEQISAFRIIMLTLFETRPDKQIRNSFSVSMPLTAIAEKLIRWIVECTVVTDNRLAGVPQRKLIAAQSMRPFGTEISKILIDIISPKAQQRSRFY
jgi:hypothetical protein